MTVSFFLNYTLNKIYIYCYKNKTFNFLNIYLCLISGIFGFIFAGVLLIFASALIILNGVEFVGKIGVEIDRVSATLSEVWGVFRNAL